jgi:hypothetical protein
MKTKYEPTIGFIKTSVNNLQELLETLTPYSYRMLTLIQVKKERIRGYQ